MPYKPKRPCAYPGCGRLAEREQYCAEHQKAMDKYYNQFQRDPASNKRYGRAWKRVRDRYIKSHPLCEECEKQGKLPRRRGTPHPPPPAAATRRATSYSLVNPVTRITVESGDRGRST